VKPAPSSPIIRGPAIPITPTQAAARDRVAAAIGSGRWPLVDNPCCCGATAATDVTVAVEDRYGLPFPQILCRHCGVIRSGKAFSGPAIGEFYEAEYRALYSGSKMAGQTFFEGQYQAGLRFARTFLAKMPAEQRGSVLEIGCGAGGILKALEDFGWRPVTGVDLGGDYLEYGRGAGLNLLQGDFRSLIAPGSQQLVVMSHVLEHLPDPVQALRDVKALIRPGGYVLIEVPGILNLHRTYAFVRHYFQGAHIYNFSLDHISLMLRACGFELVDGNEGATVLARNVGAGAAAAPPAWRNPRLVARILRFLRLLALGERLGLPPQRLRKVRALLARALPRATP
jgi:SAM-dependent methyltransferase